jgi:hypothetical protein
MGRDGAALAPTSAHAEIVTLLVADSAPNRSTPYDPAPATLRFHQAEVIMTRMMY